MRFFRNLPIGRKLTLIIMAISGVALLLAGSALAIYEQVALRHTMERDFAILTDIFDDNVASGLAFNDSVSMGHTLKTLKAHRRIVAAGVYDLKGTLVAQYRRSGPPDGFVFPTLRLAGQRFEPDRLDTFKDIVLAGETIGVVYIGADLSELRERAWLYIGIGGGLVLLCSLVTWVLTARFQRLVSGPIVELAHTVATVAAEKNYAVRAHKQGDDELGRLIDGFNEMLAQIQARDAALQQAHDQMELRVIQRTQALERAQGEAAREKDRLELIFESVPVGICLDHVIPGQARDRLINDAHFAICGLQPSTAADPAFHALTHPDDLARQAGLRAQLDAGTIANFSLEKRYIKPTGEIVWVAFTLQRRPYADGGWQDLSTVVDITELKHAQEAAAQEQARFKFIFEAVPVGISLVGADNTRAHLVNPAHERITGVSAADSNRPGVFQTATHPDDYRRQMELVQPFIRGEVSHYSVEKRYLHPGGRVVWALLTSRKFTYAATGVVQSVTTLVDITERKEAEARLVETHKQLVDTSRQAGMAEVATGVLHNVGNVLNSVNVSATLVIEQVRDSKTQNLVKIGGFLQEHASDLVAFLTEDPKGRNIPGYLVVLAGDLAAERSAIAAELEHLRKNIEHIKDIVSMQQSYARNSGVFETLSLPDLIEDALRMNAGSLARHEVQATRDYQARPVVTTDKHKVMQILINLVRNAKYACDETGRLDKKITVRTTAGLHGVEIAVIDNGIGIPAENLTRIFNHGFTTRKQGHGFGLHSAALAARELSGALSVASAGPGAGATFVLKLPYAPKGPAA